MLSSPKARVITVTSMAYRRGDIDFGNLDGPKGYSPICSGPAATAVPPADPSVMVAAFLAYGFLSRRMDYSL
jgi:hypothetical protein